MMRSSLSVLVLALGIAFTAAAADEAARSDSDAQSSLPAKSARTESLELPGVTACHTCEWRPLRTEMETDQCASKIGVFDCGRDTECNKKCEFVQCAAQ